MNNEITQDQLELDEIFFENRKNDNHNLSVKGISPCVQNHWIAVDGLGIADLITKILVDNGSVFNKGCEAKETRIDALKGGMFTSQILDKVKELFTSGTSRYPESSVRTFLSVVMQKGPVNAKKCTSLFMKNGSQLGKIYLSEFEDSERKCAKPRIIWYIVKSV